MCVLTPPLPSPTIVKSTPTAGGGGGAGSVGNAFNFNSNVNPNNQGAPNSPNSLGAVGGRGSGFLQIAANPPPCANPCTRYCFGRGGGGQSAVNLPACAATNQSNFSLDPAQLKYPGPYSAGNSNVSVSEQTYRPGPSSCTSTLAIVTNNPNPWRCRPVAEKANLARGGAGGGFGSRANSPSPTQNIGAGGGGGGGGRGNAGGAGGTQTAGGTGGAANPTTFNCVTVTPGGSVPITVASPGGQVIINWNPQ
jgi:hypothetical protein